MGELVNSRPVTAVMVGVATIIGGLNVYLIYTTIAG